MLRPLPLLLAALHASFSAAVDVSVCRDATYDIAVDASTLCAGAGAFPAGTNCPKTGTVAVAECYPYLPSYVDGQCVAPEDAVCRQVNGDTWGCVLPSIGCDDVVLGSPHCATWDYFGAPPAPRPFDGHEDVKYDARWFVQTTPLRDLWGCEVEEPTPAPTTPRPTPAATARARIATPAPTRRTPAPTPASTTRTKIPVPTPTPAPTTRNKIPVPPTPTPAPTTRNKTPVMPTPTPAPTTGTTTPVPPISTPAPTTGTTTPVPPTSTPAPTTGTKTPVSTETPVPAWTETPAPLWSATPSPTVANTTNSSAPGNVSFEFDLYGVRVGDVGSRDLTDEMPSTASQLSLDDKKKSPGAGEAPSTVSLLSLDAEKGSTGVGAGTIAAVAVAAAIAAVVAVAAVYTRNPMQLFQHQNEAEGAARASPEYEMVVTPPHAVTSPHGMTSPRL
ncbi:unnamed protein product [Hyaloperonospora brassicae]|uniref:Uncharacterized protein n=1 Tax=Hyaloperonospora brassicae TaxID=162125 RepID=A0AAV0TWA5_HYABA|nr:unnamed protein product [Hyaloperonospora brassicae]